MYQQEVFNIISSFTGHNANYVIPKEFMRLTRDTNAALILSQLVYWTGRQADPDGWIYKSYAEWEDEIFLSQKVVGTAVKKLKGLDVIETQVRMIRLDNGMLGNRCVHYRVNQGKLAELITNQLKSLQKSEREFSKTPEGNLPKVRKGISLPITNNTSKNTATTPPPPYSSELMDLVPEDFQTKAVEQVIEKAIPAYSAGYIKSAILYTTDHSNGNTAQKFKAYLGKTIEGGWAYGYESASNKNQEVIVNEFRKMPDNVLEMLAGAGNSFAKDELERRRNS